MFSAIPSIGPTYLKAVKWVNKRRCRGLKSFFPLQSLVPVVRRFPERLHRGNWGYSSPEEVSGLSERMLSWVFVTKSSPLCKGEGGNRVARICMSQESRKFEQFPVIVYMTLLKLPLAYLFFFNFFAQGASLCCFTAAAQGMSQVVEC